VYLWSLNRLKVANSFGWPFEAWFQGASVWAILTCCDSWFSMGCTRMYKE